MCHGTRRQGRSLLLWLVIPRSMRKTWMEIRWRQPVLLWRDQSSPTRSVWIPGTLPRGLMQGTQWRGLMAPGNGVWCQAPVYGVWCRAVWQEVRRRAPGGSVSQGSDAQPQVGRRTDSAATNSVQTDGTGLTGRSVPEAGSRMAHAVSGWPEGSSGSVMVGTGQLVPAAAPSQEPGSSIPLVTGIQDGVTGNPTAEEFAATDFFRTGPTVARPSRMGHLSRGQSCLLPDMPVMALTGMYLLCSQERRCWCRHMWIHVDRRLFCRLWCLGFHQLRHHQRSWTSRSWVCKCSWRWWRRWEHHHQLRCKSQLPSQLPQWWRLSHHHWLLHFPRPSRFPYRLLSSPLWQHHLIWISRSCLQQYQLRTWTPLGLNLGGRRRWGIGADHRCSQSREDRIFLDMQIVWREYMRYHRDHYHSHSRSPSPLGKSSPDRFDRSSSASSVGRGRLSSGSSGRCKSPRLDHFRRTRDVWSPDRERTSSPVRKRISKDIMSPFSNRTTRSPVRGRSDHRGKRSSSPRRNRRSTSPVRSKRRSRTPTRGSKQILDHLGGVRMILGILDPGNRGI